MGRHSSSVHFFRGKCDNIDNAGLLCILGFSGELFEYQNSFRTQFPEYCGAANELFRFLHSLVRIHGGAREKLKVVASEL